MMAATVPMRPDATTIEYHVDSRFSFDVSAINFAISAWIFSNSAVVISLVLIVHPFRYLMKYIVAPLVLIVYGENTLSHKLQKKNFKEQSPPEIFPNSCEKSDMCLIVKVCTET